jgi:hypothetical protein
MATVAPIVPLMVDCIAEEEQQLFVRLVESCPLMPIEMSWKDILV